MASSVCNAALANKKISFHERIKEWYVGNGKECKAIENQNYLIPDTIKNDTLKAIMRRDKLSYYQAIEKIIFQHQVPLAVIKAILSYGAIIAEENSITIIAPVEVTIKNSPTHYYNAEITGKICNDHIKIWHTFLRDTFPTQEPTPPLLGQVCLYAQTDSLFQQLSYQEKMSHISDDLLEGFLPPEQEDAEEIIDDHPTYIAITKKNIEYLLRKE